MLLRLSTKVVCKPFSFDYCYGLVVLITESYDVITNRWSKR